MNRWRGMLAAMKYLSDKNPKNFRLKLERERNERQDLDCLIWTLSEWHSGAPKHPGSWRQKTWVRFWGKDIHVMENK